MRYRSVPYHDNRPPAPDAPWVITYGKSGKHTADVTANSRQNAIDKFKAAYEGDAWLLNYHGVYAEKVTK